MQTQIEEIAIFRSPFATKFGIPRQSGLAESLEGEIVFNLKYRNAAALKGLDGFEYIWLIWGFSGNRHSEGKPASGFTPTVRPPRLGGNETVGVFASRSPFRPNGLGLSSVKISSIDLNSPNGPIIKVLGADLMDGTPIYDIKPYVSYTDAHLGARSGFTDSVEWQRMDVDFPQELAGKVNGSALVDSIIQVLSLDPRPAYQDDPERIYGMEFAGMDIRFRCNGGRLTVTDVVTLDIQTNIKNRNKA